MNMQTQEHFLTEHQKFADASQMSADHILKIKKNLASSIRNHIEDNRIGQTELAGEIGMRVADINRIVNGHVDKRSLKLVLSLAIYLGVFCDIRTALKV